jgi:DNA replication protein DnaC
MGYAKPVYDRAWEELSRRRLFSGEENEKRRSEVLTALPEIANIEREMAGQGASVARVIVADPSGAEERILEMSSRNLALQNRRAALLEGAGYPAEYLEVWHHCSLCKDLGYAGGKMCGCMEAILRKEAAAQLGGSSPVKDCTFDNFSLGYYSKQADQTGESVWARMRAVYQTCLSWAETFTPQSESLILMGRTGLGKTHLSSAMALMVSEAGFGVVYAPVQRMMNMLEAEKFSYGEKRADALNTYLGCDLLVLDDLGAEFSTQFTAAALFNVINTRLVEKRPTIISTNLTIEEILSRYGERMVSRLICEYQELPFEGKDIRYMRKMNRRKDNIV